MESWTVYILRCYDDTLYTGITKDLVARIKVHNEGKGAKYTRGRGPVELAYQEEQPTVSAAMRRELQIKKMKRTDKLDLIGHACPECGRTQLHQIQDRSL